MDILLRLTLSLLLAAVTAFCCFGFLASFEAPGFPVFRLLYGSVAVTSVAAIAASWLTRPPSRGA
jgi:hypothetical protein